MPNKSIIGSILIFFASLAQASTFKVSITNTSKQGEFGGQNISGPALIIHDENFNFFQPGLPASRELWEIAEEGDTTAALAMSDLGVRSTHKLTRIPRNQVEPTVNQFNVAGDLKSLRFSLAGMLTASNDGFAGLNSVNLPLNVGDQVRYELRAWDAGTEENNEQCPYVPCDEHYIRHTDGAEGKVLSHQGIKGIGDIDRLDRGWPASNIVGYVEVVRVK